MHALTKIALKQVTVLVSMVKLIYASYLTEAAKFICNIICKYQMCFCPYSCIT